MAEAVVTKAYRIKMLKARAGDLELPPITQMAFGKGGVDSSGAVKTPTTEQTALNDQLGVKDISSHSYPTDTSCKYICTLGESDYAGEEISEIALVDDDGDLAAIKNFLPKGKDSDLEMEFAVTDEF